MSTDTNWFHEDDHLRVMIEDMSRRGASEREISAAVRQASGRWTKERRGPERRTARFRLRRRRA
ncbi:MAG: hypothetical protein ACKVUT_05165 [Gaiella sp.]